MKTAGDVYGDEARYLRAVFCVLRAVFFVAFRDAFASLSHLSPARFPSVVG